MIEIDSLLGVKNKAAKVFDFRRSSKELLLIWPKN